ncbi:LacI family DNA-binding transcriptional regulator [Dactylosporangium vinaceum]|uniref:LacI family DNA-binding transcriptional regulator n=1 Tax=Dactylosporangium vinaceum TaxID=53362 RepID=A0ABV5M3B2_9ACTN|nr:LacI family DNA-binding transcriptional regulator [Dactylosporangium vinaceum]
MTAADIARSLGISRATVGFVLNNTPGQTISLATRSRVLQEASRLGYRPHKAAQALARGGSRIVLFVLPDWPVDHTMRQYLEEAAHTLDEAGYSMVTYTRHATDRARPLWEALEPEVVIGTAPFDPAVATALRASGITKLFPDPEQPIPDTPAATAGTRLQVRHLYELGHRRLAFAGATDPRLASLVAVRQQAAEETAAALGLPPLDARLLNPADDSAGAAVSTWRRAKVTAVVGYNDDIAAAVAGAAIRAGHRVPQDLAVVGHDDSPIAALFVPALSSVRIDSIGLGRFVAGMALHLADGRGVPAGPSEVDASLVMRESTAAPD